MFLYRFNPLTRPRTETKPQSEYLLKVTMAEVVKGKIGMRFICSLKEKPSSYFLEN